MCMSPWHNPITLTRAWCIREVCCSTEGEAKFSVSFGDEERKAFREAILDDFKVVQEKFAYIDVKKAKAGTLKTSG